MTRWWWLALVGVVVLAGVIGGATYWRRTADRAVLARRAALLRDFEGYPRRMRREQRELMAERERLRESLTEAEKLVDAELRAGPKWKRIGELEAQLAARERARDAVLREHRARTRIELLRGIVRTLEGKSAEDSEPPSRPPGENDRSDQ